MRSCGLRPYKTKMARTKKPVITRSQTASTSKKVDFVPPRTTRQNKDATSASEKPQDTPDPPVPQENVEENENKDLWSLEKEDELIDMWEAETHLYDMSSLGYKHPTKRQAALRRFSLQLGISVPAIEVRMRSLRTAYTKALQRYPSGSGLEPRTARTRYVMERCAFIKDHVQPRESQNTFTPPAESKDKDDNKKTDKNKKGQQKKEEAKADAKKGTKKDSKTDTKTVGKTDIKKDAKKDSKKDPKKKDEKPKESSRKSEEQEANDEEDMSASIEQEEPPGPMDTNEGKGNAESEESQEQDDGTEAAAAANKVTGSDDNSVASESPNDGREDCVEVQEASTSKIDDAHENSDGGNTMYVEPESRSTSRSSSPSPKRSSRASDSSPASERNTPVLKPNDYIGNRKKITEYQKKFKRTGLGKGKTGLKRPAGSKGKTIAKKKRVEPKEMTTLYAERSNVFEKMSSNLTSSCNTTLNEIKEVVKGDKAEPESDDMTWARLLGHKVEQMDPRIKEEFKLFVDSSALQVKCGKWPTQISPRKSTTPVAQTPPQVQSPQINIPSMVTSIISSLQASGVISTPTCPPATNQPTFQPEANQSSMSSVIAEMFPMGNRPQAHSVDKPDEQYDSMFYNT